MLFRNQKDKRFEALVKVQAKDLFRLAYSRLGSRQDAQDVVQETFLKAYRAFDNLKEGSNEAAWLTTILLNVLRDHRRRAVRRLATVPLENDSQIERPSQGSDPAEALGADEFDPQLQAALGAMPEPFLSPLLLRDLNDHTYQQISTILDIPIGTVMSRLSRARQMLRELLKENESDLIARRREVQPQGNPREAK